MATRKIRVKDSAGNIYHLETESDVVLIASDKFKSSNVKGALEELEDKKVKKGMTWNELEGL
ncbi:hypothetical protein [Clostridium weizhouense]|uniref:Uncharacterized protein n=1 Tax=Clostridium weizhouense TaxID=2859781 RepID=A0ABS7AKK4_9CLOT|nr:hypothetical protein [Clostridium weizhouense]MBW6408956.1 hypothetical protein [Clostridium weizhouense]